MVDKLDKKEEESLLDQLSKVEVKETGDEVIVVEGIEQNDTDNSNTNKEKTNEFLSNDSWEDLKIKEPIIKALHEMGFNKPSKIQTMSLSLLNKYSSKHFAGQSQNGSGKTHFQFLWLMLLTKAKMKFKELY